jgi:asparagine synthase (glutamine-hydrolysing)
MKRALAAAGLDLFDSYLALSRFLDAERLARVLHPDLGAAFSDRLLREAFARPDSGPVNRMCYADTLLYLPGLNLNYADKATMAASIECRVPFCDHVLVEKAFRLPDRFKIRGGTQKAVLRRAAARLVPAEVLERPKAPFWAPLRSWLKGPWRGLVEDALSVSRLRRQGFLNPLGVRELLEEDRRGIQDHAHAIFGLLTFQVWLDVFSPSRGGGGETG